MGKLIYVDRLKKDILALQDCYNGFSDTYDKACIIGVIDEQPTIEERKTGEWEEIEVIADAYDISGVKTWASKMRCDQCGFITFAIEGRMGQYNFCPNCGADMRGKQDG